MQNVIVTFKNILRLLEDNSIEYMVVGSVASIIYGEPRLTRDMDVVIEMSSKDVIKLEKMFPLNEYYCPPHEVLTSEVINAGQFNIIHHETGLKIDFIIRKNSEHSKEEFSRRQKIPFWEDFAAYIASPEDVIIKKLIYYQEGRSEKHLKDIQGIMANLELDYEYLNKWISKLGLKQIWKLIDNT